jgi:DNA-binding IclR family transcriptional regulator
MPREQVLAALRAEAGRPVRIEPAFEADLQRIQEEGFASIVDGTVPGVTALAAPVFDGFGEMVVALTAIGPSATLDPSREGPAAQALITCAAALSSRLGARP